MTADAVVRLEHNEVGRDLIVGDIHGEFIALKDRLDELEFVPGRDRLFSVGDLIDRGPNSDVAVEWLSQPWFHAVLGNHEEMALSASADPEVMDWWTSANGGAWWHDLDPETQERCLAAFEALPLVIEIETPHGLVGIVHADVPAVLTWSEFTERLRQGDDRLRQHALWARSRIASRSEEHRGVVEGVERIYCGHTPLRRPAVIGNVFYIDTGACYQGGEITVVDLLVE